MNSKQNLFRRTPSRLKHQLPLILWWVLFAIGVIGLIWIMLLLQAPVASMHNYGMI